MELEGDVQGRQDQAQKIIEMPPLAEPKALQGSLPVRGAWIEICLLSSTRRASGSLPVRGAWIEIPACRRHFVGVAVSLPVRGAWIEISSPASDRANSRSLPVRGAWIEMAPVGVRWLRALVAPRAGSVD